MTDQVEIHHPERGKTLMVPAALWPGRLAEKGWQPTGNDPAPPAEPAAWNESNAPTDLEQEADQLNATLDRKAELRGLLDARGVEWDGRWGVKRLEAEMADIEERQ